jgi:hypothetical protein
MVTTAAYQGIRWHMWLYYVQYIVEHLLKVYDPSSPGARLELEFPNKCADHLYSAIDILGDWVGLVQHLPEGSPHLDIPRELTQSNASIPASAAIAIGNCMGAICAARNLNEALSTTLYSSIMHDLDSLGTAGIQGAMRSFLIQSIVRTGQSGSTAEYGEWLKHKFGLIDHALRSDLGDFETALMKVYPAEDDE